MGNKINQKLREERKLNEDRKIRKTTKIILNGDWVNHKKLVCNLKEQGSLCNFQISGVML